MSSNVKTREDLTARVWFGYIVSAGKVILVAAIRKVMRRQITALQSWFRRAVLGSATDHWHNPQSCQNHSAWRNYHHFQPVIPAEFWHP